MNCIVLFRNVKTEGRKERKKCNDLNKKRTNQKRAGENTVSHKLFAIQAPARLYTSSHCFYDIKSSSVAAVSFSENPLIDGATGFPPKIWLIDGATKVSFRRELQETGFNSFREEDKRKESVEEERSKKEVEGKVGKR